MLFYNYNVWSRPPSFHQTLQANLYEKCAYKIWHCSGLPPPCLEDAQSKSPLLIWVSCLYVKSPELSEGFSYRLSQTLEKSGTVPGLLHNSERGGGGFVGQDAGNNVGMGCGSCGGYGHCDVGGSVA